MSETSYKEPSIETTFPQIDFDHILKIVAEENPSNPTFIHVGGVSAAGKSTLSALLARKLPETSVLPVDAYLIEGLWDTTKVFDHTPPDPSRPYIGGISPDIWELDLMEKHLEELEQNQAIHLPIFNETIKDRVGYRPFGPSRFVVLEGGHSFNERFQKFAGYNILVKAPFHDRLIRKIVRTHCVYGRDDIDEVMFRYFTKDEPTRRIYEDEHTLLADQIVNNPAEPDTEYQRFQGSSAPEIEGGYYSLTPKPEAGTLKENESLGIVRTRGGDFHLRYSIGSKKLIQLPITAEVAELIPLHYEVS